MVEGLTLAGALDEGEAVPMWSGCGSFRLVESVNLCMAHSWLYCRLPWEHCMARQDEGRYRRTVAEE